MTEIREFAISEDEREAFDVGTDEQPTVEQVGPDATPLEVDPADWLESRDELVVDPVDEERPVQ